MITIPFATHRPHLVLMTDGIVDVMDTHRGVIHTLRIGDPIYQDGQPIGTVMSLDDRGSLMILCQDVSYPLAVQAWRR